MVRASAWSVHCRRLPAAWEPDAAVVKPAARGRLQGGSHPGEPILPSRLGRSAKGGESSVSAGALYCSSVGIRWAGSAVSYNGQFRLVLASLCCASHLDREAERHTSGRQLPRRRGGCVLQQSFFIGKAQFEPCRRHHRPIRLSRCRIRKARLPDAHCAQHYRSRRFQAEARPYALGPRESPHLIVTRNLELIYDNATALRAFSIVRHAYPAARLTLAGTGPGGPLGKARGRAGVADAVVFSGRVDNERMAALYLSADLMLNPSLADNMPISILEALASGVPVVTTNVGGVPYLVEHEKTALLVPPKNPEAMAEAVLLLLNDPVRAEEIRQAGIDSVRQYAWPNVRARLLHVYEQLLAKTSRSMADVQ